MAGGPRRPSSGRSFVFASWCFWGPQTKGKRRHRKRCQARQARIAYWAPAVTDTVGSIGTDIHMTVSGTRASGTISAASSTPDVCRVTCPICGPERLGSLAGFRRHLRVVLSAIPDRPPRAREASGGGQPGEKGIWYATAPTAVNPPLLNQRADRRATRNMGRDTIMNRWGDWITASRHRRRRSRAEELKVLFADGTADDNPVKRVKLFKENNRRLRFVSYRTTRRGVEPRRSTPSHALARATRWHLRLLFT
jgi:hypothetical protein